LKQRRKEPREERRQDQVEVNLLVEDEGATSGGVLARARRGCAFPFFGAGMLVVAAVEAFKTGLA
jgi:hypothetical protein